ncbi:MAG: hypothetical protein SFV24_19275 [Gemmatimonadales bacterium]|nr:hypothetical protein [Gemmatimonadales bacterium]
MPNSTTERDRLRAALELARSCIGHPDNLARIDALAETAETGSVAPMDEGPWYVLGDKVSGALIGVGSDDFKRDVLLRVDGNFKCDMEKADYCAWLARTLNLNSGHSHCPHCGQWHDLKLGC